MFSKSASKSPAPRPETAETLVRKPIACSLIAENVTLRGDVATVQRGAVGGVHRMDQVADREHAGAAGPKRGVHQRAAGGGVHV